MSSNDAPAAFVEAGDVVAPDSELPGELIYEYAPRVTRIVEYGLPATQLLMRQMPPPPEGARLDLYLDGPVIGGKLNGSVTGIDYLSLRADGRTELHIHAEITVEDGKKIALEAGGLAIPEGDTPVFALREHVKLTSHHPELAWVNALQIWAQGVVDVSTGEVRLRAYAT